jgi:hypothetical protein
MAYDTLPSATPQPYPVNEPPMTATFGVPQKIRKITKTPDGFHMCQVQWMGCSRHELGYMTMQEAMVRNEALVREYLIENRIQRGPKGTNDGTYRPSKSKSKSKPSSDKLGNKEMTDIEFELDSFKLERGGYASDIDKDMFTSEQLKLLVSLV